MADRSVAVRTHGLAALNRAFGRIDKDMRREVLAKMRGTARKVRDDARPKTPVKTGAMQRSLRYSVSNRAASVSSNHPGAGVHEYGGTIRPRGKPIRVKESRMLGRSVEENTRTIEQDVGRLFDSVANSAGFK